MHVLCWQSGVRVGPSISMSIVHHQPLTGIITSTMISLAPPPAALTLT